FMQFQLYISTPLAQKYGRRWIIKNSITKPLNQFTLMPTNGITQHFMELRVETIINPFPHIGYVIVRGHWKRHNVKLFTN
ncbi:hypothetical protein QBD85_006547, partial [Pseudomonas aeruginosa]